MKKVLVILVFSLLFLQTSCFLKRSEQTKSITGEVVNAASISEIPEKEYNENEVSAVEDFTDLDSDYERFCIKKEVYEFSVTEELSAADSTFEKLAENEYLQYEYENKCLSIFAVTGEGDSRLIMQSENVSYGNYQIASDKTRIAYLEDSKDRFKPLYLVDGKAGTVKYVFNVMEAFRCDKTLTYVVFNDWTLNVREKEYNELYAEHIVIAPFENFQTDNTLIEWNLHNKNGSVLSFRSLDPDYDFRFIFDSEHLMYAEAFYNIKDSVFDLRIDVSGEKSEHPFEYKITSAEGGKR